MALSAPTSGFSHRAGILVPGPADEQTINQSRAVHLGQGIENKLNINRVEERAGAACRITLMGLGSSLGCLTACVFTFISHREDKFHVRYLQKEFFWGMIGRHPHTRYFYCFLISFFLN